MSLNIDVIQAEIQAILEEEIHEFRLEGEGRCRLSPFENTITRILFTFELEDGTEYKGTVSEEMAEAIAKAQIIHDLEYDLDMFDSVWLRDCMNDVINGETFLEYASKNAIERDGWQHFLCHYDGCEDYTESGYVFWRVN